MNKILYLKNTTNNRLRSIITFFLLLSVASVSYSQLAVYPLKHTTKPNKTDNNRQAARKKAVVLDLPFWDDFSTTKTLTPDTLLWVDSVSSSVWINNSLAFNPPSVNVATFDGLDSAFIEYSPSDVLLTGFNDQLTSQKIDLSEAKVSEAERASVYLSFYYQWQGRGESPDNEDYLEVQFLNTQNEWETVGVINTSAEFDRTKFYQFIIAISETQFFHNGFQFRIQNFGRQSGPFDTWNVDYVYLNKNRDADDLAPRDFRALSADISYLFSSYHSVPYKHFLQSAQAFDTIGFFVQNLSSLSAASNFNVEGTFINYQNLDTLSIFTKTFFESPKAIRRNEAGEPSGDVPPFQQVAGQWIESLPDVNDPQQFNPEADSLEIYLTLSLADEEGTTSPTGFEPHDLRVNDTLRQRIELFSYYAYDDGEAEYVAGLLEAGDQVAYQFEMLIDTSDILLGIDAYFPAYAVEDNQTISFLLYEDNNGMPGEVVQAWPTRIVRTQPNEFMHIRFNPAMLIDQKRFWIGWRQPLTGTPLIGLDRDNDTSDKIYVNTGGLWEVDQNVEGSLMIRPVFGTGNTDPISGIEDEKVFSIFPNPSEGSFYIEGDFERARIFSTTGKPIAFTTHPEDHRTKITVEASRGLYLLEIVNNNKTEIHKLIIR